MRFASDSATTTCRFVFVAPNEMARTTTPRIASGSAVQSVLFPAVGWERDVYYCSFAGLARLAAG